LAGGVTAAAIAPASPTLANLLTVERRPAETFTLANGLQAIVQPSRRAPIVNQLVIYKAGSAEETFGKTGIAHFLEHMMFKGTRTVGPTEFSRTISRNGGRDNAYTDFDVTGYYQTIASDRLELVMRMEADRMANLVIVDKELAPEREVVLEERRMRIDNVPGAVLDEKVRARLFGEHQAYGMPTAGYVEDVRKLTVDDLTAFYRRFYAPNNAVLIVVGDTTTEAVRKLAETYYGVIPSRPLEPRRRPANGAADLPQRVVHADARVAEPGWGRDCSVAARPAACGVRWWSRDGSRCRLARATAPRASVCRALASTPSPHPATTSPRSSTRWPIK
jgi:zinc protease